SDVAQVLSGLLAREGLATDIAATAAGAKALLARRRYQALLLDLTLPDQDGLELISELRTQENTKNLPIIVISGRASEGRSSWVGDALAVVDWLQKPVDEARLARALRQALAGTARARILHVEDNRDVVQVTQALVDGTVEYAYATTLAEARRRLAGEHFDLVLLDLAMPDGSGIDLLEELKGRVPVVIFSGLEPGRAQSQQVAAALVKTRTSNEQLLETIKRIIHQERLAHHE
ncbi:MAG: response regulator, partial [Burkholderiaceae bacterium]|nr:response regulator [Burkholderiaceae bacterium]